MEVYMNTNKIIHEAVGFILESLEAQGQAPGTLKNYKNSFSVFEKFLNEQGISKIDEDVCLEYIHFKTGRKLHSFNEKILDSSINRRMKPLHLLQMYMDTGEFLYLSLIHISEPTRLGMISYAVFCLKKNKKKRKHI